MAENKMEKIITPVFRVSFPAFFTPANFPGNPPTEAKFGCTALFDTKDPKVAEGLKSIIQLANKAGISKFGVDIAEWPKFKNPTFVKGDAPELLDKPGYGPGVVACKFTARAFSKAGAPKIPPGVVGMDGKLVKDPREIKGGDYCIAKISAYGYDFAGNRGIGFHISSVRKMTDGEPFGAKRDAVKDFESIPASIPPVGAEADPFNGISF